MANFLRRSKSTRDTRSTSRPAFHRDQHQDDPLAFPFPFPLPPKTTTGSKDTTTTATTATTATTSTSTTAATTRTPAEVLLSPSILRRSPSGFGRRKAGTERLYGEGGGGEEETTSTGTSNLFRLSRRKSISSTRESMMALGLPETWNPPSSANPMERKKRTSIFFGLASPLLPASSTQPKKAPHSHPPQPVKLSAFPPRLRQQQTSPPPPPVEDATVGVAIGEESYIGMALGSPSEGLIAQRKEAFRSMEALGQAGSPAFVLPAEAFVVASPSVPRPATSRSRKGSNGSHGSSSREKLEEPPKTAGWKRVFGRGLFGSRKGKSQKEPVPELPVHIPEPPKTPASKLKKWKSARDPKTPCLDVNIPCVEMERYSVMFGNLLPPSEKSSLFARRRSRDVYGAHSASGQSSSDEQIENQDDALSKLQGTYQAPPEVPQISIQALKRNATTSAISPRSPLSRLGDDLRRISQESRRSTSSSPSLSSSPHPHTLSPQPSPRMPSPRIPSPRLMRSKTTGSIPSPRAYAFTVNDMLSPPPPLTHTPLPNEYPFAAHDQQDSDERSTSRCSKISEESVSSISTPPGSYDEGDDGAWMARSACDDAEPVWEMVTRPSTAGPPYRDDDEISVAAQISIARQISLSQRQLLLPIVPKSQMLVSRRSIKDPSCIMKPRLVEHRTSTAAAKRPPERAVIEGLRSVDELGEAGSVVRI